MGCSKQAAPPSLSHLETQSPTLTGGTSSFVKETRDYSTSASWDQWQVPCLRSFLRVPLNPSQSPYIPMKFYEIPVKSHDFSRWGVRRAALPPSLRRWRSGSVAGDRVSQRHPSLLSRGRGVIPFKVGKVLGDFIRYIRCCLNSGNYP